MKPNSQKLSSEIQIFQICHWTVIDLSFWNKGYKFLQNTIWTEKQILGKKVKTKFMNLSLCVFTILLFLKEIQRNLMTQNKLFNRKKKKTKKMKAWKVWQFNFHVTSILVALRLLCWLLWGSSPKLSLKWICFRKINSQPFVTQKMHFLLF